MIKWRFFFLVVSIAAIFGFSVDTYAATIHYRYDANGNLISGAGLFFEYNDANRLIRVRQGDADGPILEEYVYDYRGQRIKKRSRIHQVTYTTYDYLAVPHQNTRRIGDTTYYPGKHYEEHENAAGSSEINYYFANRQRIAKFVNHVFKEADSEGEPQIIETTEKVFYLNNHLGSTDVVVADTGQAVNRIKYYPFGDIRHSGDEQYTYTGKEKDLGTNNYYFEARYYDIGFLHFTQADNIVPNIYDPQSLNRYSYVRNNPLTLIDPHGNSWWNPFSWFQGNDHARGQSSPSHGYEESPGPQENIATVNLFPPSYTYQKSEYKKGKTVGVSQERGECTGYAKAITNYDGSLGFSDCDVCGPTMDEVLDASIAANPGTAFRRGDGTIQVGYIVYLDMDLDGDAEHVAVVVKKEGTNLTISEQNREGKGKINEQRVISDDDKSIIGAHVTTLKQDE